MTINKNLSHLDSPLERDEKTLSYARVLVEAWAELAAQRGTLEHAVEGTSMRHSMSGKCARAIHYYLTDTEISNPFDLPAYWSTGLGTAVHTWWQSALRDIYPDAEIEVVCHIPEADSSGHADALIVDAGQRVCLELKSINGYGFKLMAEGGQGPRHEHYVQACMNGYALDADKVVLVYLSLEAVSKGRAKSKGLDEVSRIAKEFHFERAEYWPVAEKEIKRWAEIRKLKGETPRRIPDPEYVPGSIVVDPSNGMMKKGEAVTGYAWSCSYCGYQDQCCEDLNGET